MFLCHTEYHMWITFFFFFKWYLDRICNMRVGLYFLFLFTYITYALIFLLKMKDARKTQKLLFACFVLVFGDFLKKIIIKVKFSGTALK